MNRTLDTNICSYILRQRPASMVARFAQLNPEGLWLSAVVAAELRYGAAKLGQPRFHAAVEAWLAGFDVRDWSSDASHHYAQLRAALEKAGKPIGGMDMMIAAHAMAEDSVLVTNNAREFHRVPGLAVEEWALDD
jgi:tRNA(fMet)-specific endonuclease VapC